jgi:phage antirepressor YoqD-like protein
LPSFVQFRKVGINGESLVTMISPVSVLCKIYSGIPAGRLRDWLINNKILSRFQAGFVKDKRTTDNIFPIKTTVDRYLKEVFIVVWWP